MTVEEAHIYLPQEDGVDLIDLYESNLFVLKQFLVGHFPVSKVVQAKIKRIELLNTAYVALGGVLDSPEELCFDFNAPEDLVSAHEVYVKYKSQYRTAVMNTGNGLQLIQICNAYIEFIRLYALVWQQNFDDFDGVVVSKEPDDMDLFHAVSTFGDEGKSQIHEIDTFIDGKNVLLDESKRLSLWLKLDSNV